MMMFEQCFWTIVHFNDFLSLCLSYGSLRRLKIQVSKVLTCSLLATEGRL